MRKVLVIIILITMFAVGCKNKELIARANAEVKSQAEYTINIDTVTQGEVKYKKLVIHNHKEYNKEDILLRSKELIELIEEDVSEFGEVSIIFYKDDGMFCVVDPTTNEIYYIGS